MFHIQFFEVSELSEYTYCSLELRWFLQILCVYCIFEIPTDSKSDAVVNFNKIYDEYVSKCLLFLYFLGEQNNFYDRSVECQYLS